MTLDRLLEQYYGGNFSEALNLVKELSDEAKIVGKVIESLITRETDSRPAGKNLGIQAYQEAKDHGNLYIQYLVTLLFSLHFIPSTNEYKMLGKFIQEIESNIEFASEEERMKIQVWDGLLYNLKGFSLFFGNSREDGLKLLFKGLEIAQEYNNNWQMGMCAFNIGRAYQFITEYDKSREFFNKSSESFRKLDNSIMLGYSILWINTLNLMEKKYESVIKNNNEVLEICEKNKLWTMYYFVGTQLYQSYNRQKKMDELFELLTQKLEIYEKNKFENGIMLMNMSLNGYYNYHKNDHETALLHMNKAEELIRKNHHVLVLAIFIENHGIYHRSRGEFEKAEKYSSEAYDIRKQFLDNCDEVTRELNSFDLGRYYGNMALLSFEKGNYKQALEYFDKFIPINEKWGYSANLTLCYITMGRIKLIQGEFENSIEYFKNADELLADVDIDTYWIFIQNWIYNQQSLGLAAYQMGNYEKSLDYFERAKKHAKKHNRHHDMATCNVSIINSLLELDKYDQVSGYVDEFDELIEASKDDPVIIKQSKLAKGLWLKNSPRITQKAEAQTLFRELSEDPEVLSETSLMAKLNLCDLLVAELQSFGEQEAFTDVSKIINEIHETARKEHSYNLMAQTYLLKSKIALIDLDIDQSKEMLTKAEEIAKNKELGKLLITIQDDQQLLIKNLTQWTAFANENLPLMERVKKSEIQQYIANASKIVQGGIATPPPRGM